MKMTEPINRMIDEVCKCTKCGKPASAKCNCWSKVRQCAFRGCRRRAVHSGKVSELSGTYNVCAVHGVEWDFTITGPVQ